MAKRPDFVKNQPIAQGRDYPAERAGLGGAGGSSGGIGILPDERRCVISGEGGVFTTPTGQRGAMLRAYDKATGKDVGEVYMPGSQTGTPMTYMHGRQAVHRRRDRRREHPGRAAGLCPAVGETHDED